mmetsp:Transcript_8446/g.52817  ORF Transcript_8446/g.52817 Transcript_8446/m.52817 type:complete len:113 (-) Transcript_8446:1518-1856(-)
MEPHQPQALHIAPGPEQHRCGQTCHIVHVMGNLYKCIDSGQCHVCDRGCQQRVVYSPTETICRLSRRVFRNEELVGVAPPEWVNRKRDSMERGFGVPGHIDLEAHPSKRFHQ